MRSCVVCREHATKRGLLRIVRQPDGAVVIDPSGRLNGRGTYVCDKPTCLQKAAESEILVKALNAPVPEDVRNHLRTLAQFGATNAPDAAQNQSEVE
jgi:predicted RNA-binding protein YlxR (DUF448 family)